MHKKNKNSYISQHILDITWNPNGNFQSYIIFYIGHDRDHQSLQIWLAQNIHLHITYIFLFWLLPNEQCVLAMGIKPDENESYIRKKVCIIY